MKPFSLFAVATAFLGASVMTCHAADGLRGVKDTDGAAIVMDTSNSILNDYPNALDEDGRSLAANAVDPFVSPTCKAGYDPANGKCEKTEKTPLYQHPCPDKDYIVNDDGKCHRRAGFTVEPKLIGTAKCPTGFDWSPVFGTCQMVTEETDPNTGKRETTTKAELPTCSKPYFLRLTINECMECPEGAHYNAVENMCEKQADTGEPKCDDPEYPLALAGSLVTCRNRCTGGEVLGVDCVKVVDTTDLICNSGSEYTELKDRVCFRPYSDYGGCLFTETRTNANGYPQCIPSTQEATQAQTPVPIPERTPTAACDVEGASVDTEFTTADEVTLEFHNGHCAKTCMEYCRTHQTKWDAWEFWPGLFCLCLKKPTGPVPSDDKCVIGYL